MKLLFGTNHTKSGVWPRQHEPSCHEIILRNHESSSSYSQWLVIYKDTLNWWLNFKNVCSGEKRRALYFSQGYLRGGVDKRLSLGGT